MPMLTSTWPINVVGIRRYAIPRRKIDAANPATSRVTPPPTATIIPCRPNWQRIATLQISSAWVQVFLASVASIHITPATFNRSACTHGGTVHTDAGAHDPRRSRPGAARRSGPTSVHRDRTPAALDALSDNGFRAAPTCRDTECPRARNRQCPVHPGSADSSSAFTGPERTRLERRAGSRRCRYRCRAGAILPNAPRSRYQACRERSYRSH